MVELPPIKKPPKQYKQAYDPNFVLKKEYPI